MIHRLYCIATLFSVWGLASSFHLGSPNRLEASQTGLFASSSIAGEIDPNAGTLLTSKGLHKRDCYVATNRFAVRQNQQAVFEKRWTTRKSRLAVLPGFRYFHLMRRVTEDGLYEEGDSDEAALENYVSFTIWDKKSDFSAWRKGDAFKEAHGGTSIVSFLSTMVNSAFVLRGAPRPAFYDGLFLNYEPTDDEKNAVVDGWRQVEADGINTLPAECYVETTKYFVSTAQASEFEQLWNDLGNDLGEGKMARSLMRRDGQAKGHGVTEMDSSEPTYVAATIFHDKGAYLKRRKESEDSLVSLSSSRPPETVLYEGMLMLTPQSP